MNDRRASVGRPSAVWKNRAAPAGTTGAGFVAEHGAGGCCEVGEGRGGAGGGGCWARSAVVAAFRTGSVGTCREDRPALLAKNSPRNPFMTASDPGFAGKAESPKVLTRSLSADAKAHPPITCGILRVRRKATLALRACARKIRWDKISRTREGRGLLSALPAKCRNSFHSLNLFCGFPRNWPFRRFPPFPAKARNCTASASGACPPRP